MVEAHGTGTPVGDPIEYAGLAQVYGTEAPCALGAVKTNFGHGQSASGAVGMMKAILCLQHATVPQNLHFRSEEHTSELQSLMRISYAVFCLKKKKQNRQ